MLNDKYLITVLLVSVMFCSIKIVFSYTLLTVFPEKDSLFHKKLTYNAVHLTFGFLF